MPFGKRTFVRGSVRSVRFVNFGSVLKKVLPTRGATRGKDERIPQREGMEHTESPAQIAEWAPLVMDGRKVIDIQRPAAPAQAAAKRA